VVVISFFLLLELRCEATPLLFVTIRLFARADGEVFSLRMLLLWYPAVVGKAKDNSRSLRDDNHKGQTTAKTTADPLRG
jgi:hypothetical protein